MQCPLPNAPQDKNCRTENVIYEAVITVDNDKSTHIMDPQKVSWNKEQFNTEVIAGNKTVQKQNYASIS